MIFSLLPYLFPQSVLLKVIWKSKVFLNPPWREIFRGDTVSLTCGTNSSSEDKSPVWIHNRTRLTVSNSRLDIVNADVQNSGEYQCRIKGYAVSEPVYLNVTSGKFQGYRNINSLMCGMARQNGEKASYSKAQRSKGELRVSLHNGSICLLPLLHLPCCLLSIFQQSPSVMPLVCFISIFSAWVQMHVTWSNGILDM